MNKKQWIILGGIFFIAGFWTMFQSGNQDCVSDSFDNFANSINSNSYNTDYAYNEYNLIQCAVEERIYDGSYVLFNKLAWFLAFICFIMGFLEHKNKKDISDWLEKLIRKELNKKKI